MKIKKGFIGSSIVVTLFKFTILTTIFSVLVSVLCETSVQECIYFILFQVFGLLIPGMAVILLTRFPIKTDIELLTSSYATGYISNIVLYYCLMPLGLSRYIKYMAIVVALLSLIVIIKCKHFLTFNYDKKGNIICGFFLVILLGIEICTVAGTNMLVPTISQNVFANDSLYWIGNTIALMKQYPPRDFRSYQEGYNYHYFSSMQMAVCSFITGIRPIVLGFYYFFFEAVILMVLGSYSLFKRLTKKSMSIIIGLILLFFTTGNESKTWVDYISHLLIQSFGFDFGVGMLAILAFYLVLQLDEEKVNKKILIFSLIQFGVLAGTKVPMAVIGLSAIGMLCVMWLVKKQYTKALCYGGPILAVFLLGYIVVFNVSGYANISSMDYFSSIFKLSEGLLVLQSQHVFLREYLPNFLFQIVFFFVYTIQCNPPVIGLFWIGVFLKIGQRDFDRLDISCIFATLVGMILTTYTFLYGYSQMYFIIASYVLTIIFILRTFEKYLDAIKKFRIIKYISIGMLAILMAIGIQNAFIERTANGYPLGIINYLKIGVSNFKKENKIANDLFEKYQLNYTNQELADMYQFIYDHTEGDDVIACNMSTQIAGAMSERYVIARDEVSAIIQENNNEAAILSLSGQGIKYILCVRNSEVRIDQIDDKNPLLTLLYTNENASLYQIK